MTGRKKRAARKSVIIVGAGLAGLSSAYELDKMGYEVLVLEAQNRPGGRVETIRKPFFTNGLHAEAGAMFVSSRHDFVMKFVQEFNLALDRVFPDDASFVYYIKGKRVDVTGSPDDPWPDLSDSERVKGDLSDAERPMGLYGILGQYAWAGATKIGDPTASGWPTQDLQQYDSMSFLDYLKAQNLSQGAINLIRPWYAPWWDELDKVSALVMLRDSAIGEGYIHDMDPDPKNKQKWYTIKDGMDSLPRAFAARLGGKIRYKAPVIAINQETSPVTVTYMNAGKKESKKADYVICAIPFSTLKSVKIKPAFSPEKQNAIEQLPYASVARVYLQCKERIWAKTPWIGLTYTDLPIMNILDSTPNQLGPSGIIHAFMSGSSAQTIRSLKEKDRVPFVLGQMELVYPGIAKTFERGYSKCWDDKEDWALGAYPIFRPSQPGQPGQMFSLMPHIPGPEGRVHFAGDHTSPWPGWIQGALQSGNRAAQEVMQAP